MSALLQLVYRGGDGKSVSLCDKFTQILEEDGVYQSFSLYKERRFTKLGYTAGAIFIGMCPFYLNSLGINDIYMLKVS